MVALPSLAAAFASVLFFIPSSFAHSTRRDPLEYITVVNNIKIHTPSQRVHSYSQFDLTFDLHDGQKEFRLVLHPNHDLLHQDFAVTVLDADGNLKSVEQVDRSEHKVYRGDAFITRPGEIGWSKAGWARITMHRDGKLPIFEGAFQVDGNNHHIQTGTHYSHLKHHDDPEIPILDDFDKDEVMVAWRDSDVRTWFSGGELKRRDLSSHDVCNSDSLAHNRNYDWQQRESRYLQGIPTRSLFGRQAIDGGSSGPDGGQDFIATIGKTDGCPATTKVALVGIATDCTYWEGFNSSADLRKYVIGVVNQASQVYESSFKISLGIKNLTVLERGCPGTASPNTPWNVDCSDSTTISDRLNLFSAWRGKSQDSNAYWTLFTSCGTESAVGLAWRGELCSQGSIVSRDGTGNNETVASANVVVKTPSEWQVFAHETGHTFGAVHDCTSSTCPVNSQSQSCCPFSSSTCDADGRFIMNPSTGTGITAFSPCTIGNICSSLKSAQMSSCLTDNKNIETITGSQCGNGIVEPGEECDCGGSQGCANNSCCDPQTCKFTTGSVCDPSNEDCCTSQCQFAGASTVCRPSIGECDVQETCPGNAAKCPDDEHKPDGQSCGGGNGLQCASGQCTSRDRQCQAAVGTEANNSSTKACGEMSNSCQVACTADSLQFSNNQCLVFGQNFIDGTPCGAGGHCSNGTCSGSSNAKEIKQWVLDHKPIVIPVASVLGVLLLIVIGSCVFSCCRTMRIRKARKQSPDMYSWPSSSRAQWEAVQTRSADQHGYGMEGLRPMDNSEYPPPPGPGLPYFGPGGVDHNSWNGTRSPRYA